MDASQSFWRHAEQRGTSSESAHQSAAQQQQQQQHHSSSSSPAARYYPPQTYGGGGGGGGLGGSAALDAAHTFDRAQQAAGPPHQRAVAAGAGAQQAHFAYPSAMLQADLDGVGGRSLSLDGGPLRMRGDHSFGGAAPAGASYVAGGLGHASAGVDQPHAASGGGGGGGDPFGLSSQPPSFQLASALRAPMQHPQQPHQPMTTHSYHAGSRAANDAESASPLSFRSTSGCSQGSPYLSDSHGGSSVGGGHHLVGRHEAPPSMADADALLAHHGAALDPGDHHHHHHHTTAIGGGGGGGGGMTIHGGNAPGQQGHAAPHHHHHGGAHKMLPPHTPHTTTTTTNASSAAQAGGGHGGKPRHKTTPEQLRVLEAVFADTPKPSLKTRREMSQRIGMSERSIQIWFQNRRSRSKSGGSSSSSGGGSARSLPDKSASLLAGNVPLPLPFAHPPAVVGWTGGTTPPLDEALGLGLSLDGRPLDEAYEGLRSHPPVASSVGLGAAAATAAGGDGSEWIAELTPALFADTFASGTVAYMDDAHVPPPPPPPTTTTTMPTMIPTDSASAAKQSPSRPAAQLAAAATAGAPASMQPHASPSPQPYGVGGVAASASISHFLSITGAESSIVQVPATSLLIGEWQRLHPLTCYFSKKNQGFGWSLVSESVGFKLELPCTSLRALLFRGPLPGARPGEAEGALYVELERPPQFFMEVFPSGNKPESQPPPRKKSWRQCEDFTEGRQATLFYTHVVTGPYQPMRSAMLEIASSNGATARRLRIEEVTGGSEQGASTPAPPANLTLPALAGQAAFVPHHSVDVATGDGNLGYLDGLNLGGSISPPPPPPYSQQQQQQQQPALGRGGGGGGGGVDFGPPSPASTHVGMFLGANASPLPTQSELYLRAGMTAGDEAPGDVGGGSGQPMQQQGLVPAGFAHPFSGQAACSAGADRGTAAFGIASHLLPGRQHEQGRHEVGSRPSTSGAKDVTEPSSHSQDGRADPPSMSDARSHRCPSPGGALASRPEWHDELPTPTTATSWAQSFHLAASMDPGAGSGAAAATHAALVGNFEHQHHHHLHATAAPSPPAVAGGPTSQHHGRDGASPSSPATLARRASDTIIHLLHASASQAQGAVEGAPDAQHHHQHQPSRAHQRSPLFEMAGGARADEGAVAAAPTVRPRRRADGSGGDELVEREGFGAQQRRAAGDDDDDDVDDDARATGPRRDHAPHADAHAPRPSSASASQGEGVDVDGEGLLRLPNSAELMRSADVFQRGAPSPS